jgi:hypothetical protein
MLMDLISSAPSFSAALALIPTNADTSIARMNATIISLVVFFIIFSFQKMFYVLFLISRLSGPAVGVDVIIITPQVVLTAGCGDDVLTKLYDLKLGFNVILFILHTRKSPFL